MIFQFFSKFLFILSTLPDANHASGYVNLISKIKYIYFVVICGAFNLVFLSILTYVKLKPNIS